MSTLLMVASDVLLYEHHVSKGDIGKYDNPPLAIGLLLYFPLDYWVASLHPL